MESKTNVMRILDAHHIPYSAYSYVGTGATSGDAVAAALHQNPAQVFKTLVTVARSGHHYVGEKSIDMLKSRDLLGLTGYVHGGCSPIGMKKQFKTVIDKTAQNFKTIIFSAGRVGYQVEVAVSDLSKIIPFSFSDLTVQSN